jgi:hypothetical protein
VALIPFSFDFHDCAQNCARAGNFFQIRGTFFRCFDQIRIVHDIVPLEDRPGFVARDFHGHLFRHSRADHIPDSAPTKVMKDHTGNPDLFTDFLPGFVKLLDPIGAVAIEEYPGQKLPALVEHPLAKFPLLRDDLFFFIIEVGDPGVIVFRLPGLQADDTKLSIDLNPG